MVYSGLNFVQHMLLPGRCVLCHALSGRTLDLCQPCELDLTQAWAQCLHCGLPCTSDVPHCGECTARPFQFSRCVALGSYGPPLDRLIGNFKYRRHWAAGSVLAKLLAQRLQQRYRDDTLPPLLIPVPLHWRRQWRRSFNQAHFLAARLGESLGIPVDDTCLLRQRNTASQKGLNRPQRLANLRHAFALKTAPKVAHIALIDDVVTTATTANLLATLLREAGVQRVDIWCLARTPPGTWR